MKTILKILGYLVGGVLTILVILVAVLKLIPDDQYKEWITTAASSATGRDVALENFELDIGTALSVRADKFQMANAKWGSKANMLTVDRLEADFGLLPLLSGKADIRAVVERADMHVESNADGISNWAMGSGKPEPDEKETDVKDDSEFTGLPLHPVIREVRIDDFKLTQIGAPDAEPKVISLKQFLVETPEKDTTIRMAADVGGRPVTLNGNLGDMAVFIDKASQPLQLDGDINGNSVKVSGNWGPIFPDKIMQIDLAVIIPATTELAKLVGLEIEEFEDINITGKIIGDGDRFSLDPLVVNLDDPTAKLSINGSVDDLANLRGIKISTDANTDSFKTLLRQLGIELAGELPPEMELSANINGGLEDLALSELVVEARDEGVDLKVTTTIGDLLNINKVGVNLTGNIDSLARLSKYAQTELPDTDPVILNASLSDNEATTYALKVNAKTGEVNIDLSSAFESLAVPEKIDIDVSVTASSMTDFNKLAQTEFNDVGPLDLKTAVQVAKGDIAVNDLVLKLKNQTAKGNFGLKLPDTEEQPMAINGKLAIDYLNLNHLLPKPAEPIAEGEAAPPAEPAAAEATEVADAKPADPSDRLFSSEPFLRDQLLAYDVDLAVTADRFEFGKADMTDVQLAVLLKEGLLTVEPIKAKGTTGNINGVVRIDGRSEVPSLDVDLAILQMPMPNLGGALDFDVDLDGAGNSVADLMASLNGQMLLVVKDGKIEQSLASSFGTGLLSFSEEKDYTELECAILRVDVKDGIADFEDKLAAQLTEVTWKGGGEINLKTEALEAGISPKPRKGIPISAGSLASLVYVGGTLKNPKVQLDPKDVAVKYAKYTAHVATGGITLVADAIKNKIQANQDVCEQILKGTVFEEADKAAEKAEKEAAKAKEKAE